MELVEWNDSLATGHPVLDNQHISLFKLINQLDDALQTGNCDDRELEWQLQHLERQTRNHFRYEERIMLEQRYPHLDAHRECHRRIERDGESLLERYRSGEASLVSLLPTALRDWVCQHVKMEDTRLASYLRRCSRQ